MVLNQKIVFPFLSVLCFFFGPVFSQEEKSGVSPEIISLPSGPGSMEGLGPDFEPSLGTGSSVYRVDIEVPPGHNGLTPQVSLEYNSGYGNGIAGIGRKLSTPSIRRKTADGIPFYDSRDIFEYSGMELVYLTDDTYTTRNGSAGLRFEREGKGWKMTDRSGTVYRFGKYPEEDPWQRSRIGTGGLDFDQTFEWLLDEVTDVLGNRIEYRRSLSAESPGKLYLSEIRYAQTAELFHSVIFEYEERPDSFTRYISGFPVTTALRLKRVLTKPAGKNLYEYRFDYELSEGESLDGEVPGRVQTSFSRLRKVSKCAFETDHCLPPVRFGYTGLYRDDVDFWPLGNFPSPEDVDLNGNGSADGASIRSFSGSPPLTGFFSGDSGFFDLNGDSLPDLLNTAGGVYTWYPNGGDDRFRSSRPVENAPPVALSSPAIIPLDFDGDGLADLLHRSSASKWVYYRNRGNGSFAPGVAETSPPAFDFSGTNTRFFDLNFDGKSDIVRSNPGGLWNYCLAAKDVDVDFAPYGNFPGVEDEDHDGNGRIDPPAWECSGSVRAELFADAVFSNPAVRTADMNGDRMMDIVRFSLDNGKVHLGYWPTSGLLRFSAYRTMLNPPEIPGARLSDIKLMDVNGDGLPDLLYIRSGSLSVRFNRGNRTWADELKLENTPEYDFATTLVRFADMNASGAVDPVWIRAAGQISYLDFGGGIKAGLLKTIDNGLGKRILISYEGSGRMIASAEAEGNPWTSFSPVATQSVIRVETGAGLDSGRFNSLLTFFEYRNPWYHPYKKEFRGFASVRKTLTGDAEIPDLLEIYKLHTGAPDGIDNDGDGTIDERGLNGETEEESLAGQILSLRKTDTATGETEEENLDFSFTENRWQVLRLHTPEGGSVGIPTARSEEVSQPLLLQSETKLIEKGAGSPQTLRIENVYDGRGEKTAEKNYGALSVSGDEVFTFYEYARNTDKNLSKPYRKRITDREENTVSEQVVYFDGEKYVGLPAGKIEAGLVSRVSGLVNDNEYIDLERKAYDEKGNLTESIDGEGGERQMAYDSLMNLYPVRETIFTDKDTQKSLEVTAEYDLTLGRPISSTDFNGNQTRFVYDALGRIIAVISPADTAEFPTQSFEYRPADPLRALYYPPVPEFGKVSGGAVRAYSPAVPYSSVLSRSREQSGFPGTLDSRQYFDSLGRKIAVYTEAERGFIVNKLTIYNRRGIASKIYLPFQTYIANFSLPPSSNTAYSEIFYDALGRNIKAVHPPDAEGTRYFTTREYTPLLLTEKNEKNNPKVTSFDGRGKTLSVTEKNGKDLYTVRFGYDTPGNLISVTDAEGNLKTNTYDLLRRKTGSSDPDRGITSLTYDKVGRVIQRVDNKNQKTLFSYDEAGRVLTENFVSYPEDEDPEIEYVYDSPDPGFLFGRNLKGQISRISEPSGVRFFSYDQKGNLEKTLRRINSEDAESKEFSEFFAFDALGRIMVKTGPDGEAIRFEYGKRGLPVLIEGFLEDLRYNAAGLITSVTYANGVENRRSYDPRQRLIGLETSDPNGTVFQELSYRYGATGNITRIEDGTEAGEAANASQSFLYDATDRLIRASGNYGIIDYAYDGTGNMIWKGSPQRQSAGHIADPDINLGRMIYGGSAGSKNRKEKANKPGPHAITHTQSGLIFDYDANGNRISATAGGGVSTGDAKYEWNWQDRMKRFEGKEATADYLYGYDGKRAVKQVETPGGISETLYVSDDYEIRDGTAYKYIFTDGQRIASIAKSADSGREETKEILLKEGWNSLSFSIRPEEKSPRGVFESVLPQIKAVYSFDPKNGNYLVWRPGNLSNLTEITTGKGYFVQMKQDATLILEGSKAAPLIHLERGWQLIPAGVKRETGVKALIKSISGKVSSVWYYDKEKKAGKYHFTNPELNGLNTLKSVLPDTAIWVQMETAGFYLPQTRQSGEKTFYHPDHLGSTNFTTDSEGKVTGRYEYYPYGKERLQPATNPFYKHTNHETDLESALVYSVHRYRDTITGQFLSVDPLLANMGLPYKKIHDIYMKYPQEHNLYSYVLNNPINLKDETGLFTPPHSELGQNQIVIDAFIMTKEIEGFKGDNRGNVLSTPEQSRLTVWIDTDSGAYRTHVSPSTYIETDIPRPRPPSEKNKISVIPTKNGFEIIIYAINSAIKDSDFGKLGGPAIDNHISLEKSGDSWKGKMVGDEYPSWEINAWEGNSREQLLFSEESGNPIYSLLPIWPDRKVDIPQKSE